MENFKINYYQLSVQETLKTLSSRNEGLKNEEIFEREKIYGQNKLVIENHDPLIFRILRQFKDLMVIILILAGTFSLYLHDLKSAIIMYAIVLINATVSFIQEYRAEKTMDSLKVLVEAKAKVIRNNQELEIKQEELVPGDVVILEEGDAVPADLRVLEEHNLATNDFALTGESNPSRKFSHSIAGKLTIGDRQNLLYMGTTVAMGNGKGIVIATGMQTEIGNIAHLTQETVTDFSPLQRELDNIARNLTYITLVIAAILFAIALIIDFTISEALIFAIGVAAAMVPEGLPAQVTVSLSLAAARLAEKNAVVKKLSAVETLGSTHVICTDKTGTLTKNEMTVQKIMIGDSIFETTGTGYQPTGFVLNENGEKFTDSEIKKYSLFFEDGIFASNARISPPDKDHPEWYSVGDPTEAALITLGRKVGFDPAMMDREYPEILEFPFDASRKRMTSIRKKDGKIMAFVKGSPQSVLAKCTHFWDGTTVRKITEEDRSFIEKKDNEFALDALRNLAYACREIQNYSDDLKMEEVESGLTWLGLAAMIDPPRDEVKAAMAAAIKANIKVIIITGDYALTAQAIAKKIGLYEYLKDEVKLINGDDLQKISDAELVTELKNSNLIFARTSPEDKLRIVSLIEKSGEVVAVTGDGVNDAPALKKANIGVAMGRTGTEVAKNSAQIVLLNDSFATLVSAIHEGRVIFQNLKKTILVTICGNSAELFTVLISLAITSFFDIPLAILGYQILAVDLVGEMFPLMALTWDPAQPGTMTAKPRSLSEHIINKKSILVFAVNGLAIGLIAYLNFYYAIIRYGETPFNLESTNPAYFKATTLTYISIVFMCWANVLSFRVGSSESVFGRYLFSNKKLAAGFAIALLFMFAIVYNPWINSILSTAPLGLADWGYGLGSGLLFLALTEIYKAFKRKGRKF